MSWLKNNFVFLFAIVLIISALYSLTQLDSGGTSALGFVVVSTALTAIGSIATYMQALEAKKQRENSEQPEVAVYFQPANRLIYCVLQNFGNLPAKNITVVFEPSPMLHDGRRLQDVSLFASILPFLPPREKYWKHLGASPEVIKRNPGMYRVIVKFESLENRKFKNIYEINFSSLGDANDPERSISAQLGTISEQLVIVNRALNDIRPSPIDQYYRTHRVEWLMNNIMGWIRKLLRSP